MKMVKLLVLAGVLIVVAGCGKSPDRKVTDGVDLDAIKAYEAAVNNVQQQDASIDLRAQAIADEKAAAAEMKKAAEDAKNATP